jgi:phospholipid/cholesterol/gamma-HCH transport system substrate-binding protein
MTRRHLPTRLTVVAMCSALLLSGCAWQGVSSLPLPGAPGRVPGATVYHVEIANVGTLESNSPVLIDDVTVGSIGAITVVGWHADVEVFAKPDAIIPANAIATIGQTSLLGSSHLALNAPAGHAPAGRLQPGTTIPLNSSSTYPSTEQTLASLSTVVNGGGLGQIGSIVSSFNSAFDGRQEAIRDLLTRLNTFVGTFADQREDIIATIQALNRLAGTFAQQRDVLTEALQKLPPALEVLAAERPRITTALQKLQTFSDISSAVISDVQADLVENLRHLEPTVRAFADVGTDLNKALIFSTAFPYGQKPLDQYVKGDFLNLSATVDLTIPRLKRELFMGTRWGDPTQQIQAAIGDPGYAEQTRDPLGIGVAPPPPVIATRPPAVPPPPLPAAPQSPPASPGPAEAGSSSSAPAPATDEGR